VQEEEVEGEMVDKNNEDSTERGRQETSWKQRKRTGKFKQRAFLGTNPQLPCDSFLMQYLRP
jgi:hypothetical protein